MYVGFIRLFNMSSGQTRSMCSHEGCASRSFYDVDGKLFCKSHNTVDLGACGVAKRDGNVCGCRARRSRGGVNTCLVHIPKSSEVVCCSICLEDVPIGTKPTKCGHVFHTTCMNTWRTQPGGHTCPMCRTELINPFKHYPPADLMEQVTRLAREAADVEEFMETLLRTVPVDELRMVIDFVTPH
jgi:hypothetical protein